MTESGPTQPTLEEVRAVVATMVEHSTRAWIGEGDEIAKELLDYIDGKSPETLAEWKQGMDEWVYLVTDERPEGVRGPFDSRHSAEAFLAKIPEQGVAVSEWGPTAPRASYKMLTREQFKHESAPRP